MTLEVLSASGTKGKVVTPLFFFNRGGVICKVDTPCVLNAPKVVSELTVGNINLWMQEGCASPAVPKCVLGRGDFSVSFYIVEPEISSSHSVVSQVGGYTVSVDMGRICFSVSDMTVISERNICDGALHYITCNKERNGMLRIFIDGEVDLSVYSESTCTHIVPREKIDIQTGNGYIGGLSIMNRAIYSAEHKANVVNGDVNNPASLRETSSRADLLHRQNYYNLKGQLVYSGTEIPNLGSGVYVRSGKKILIR